MIVEAPTPCGVRFARSGAAPRRLFPGPRPGEPQSANRCATVCYSDRAVKDDLTRRLQSAATDWRDVFGMSDERLAEQIRADRIEILFDLAGHTAGNRLLVFARKPAPIQVTWIGYEGTTGLAAMDYLIADRHVVPEEASTIIGKCVLRMPDGYLCYDPPAAAPPTGPPPALRTGYATFGSFNNLAKITPEVVAVWAKILRRSRRAVGLETSRVGRPDRETAVSGSLCRARRGAATAGVVARESLSGVPGDISAGGPGPGSLSLFRRRHHLRSLVDGRAGDYLPGETFASRHSLSHLSNVGLTETIARDLNEYVELAVSSADDLPRLAALRAGLRPRMAASPLCDGKRFAENFLFLLRDAWRQACDRTHELD